jgi:N-acetylglutamate synthase/N-acetylornithine aminotransferase
VFETSCLGLDLKNFLKFFPATEDITDRGVVVYISSVSSAMKNPKIQIRIELGLGKGRDRVLTCDLTKEYIAINGDYRS